MKPCIPLLIVLMLVSTSFVGVSYTADKSSHLSFDGNILYVGGSGSGNYTKIQDAIDNASNGDTVFVYNGTYVENVVVNKSISLIGEDRNTTVIDGNKIGTVVSINAHGVNISGLTIQNSGSYPTDAGIKIQSDNCYISYNTITNNSLGIHGYYCDNTKIENNQIINNYHGIFIFTQNNNNEISQSGIVDNVNGIFICNSDNSIIEYNFIFNNTGEGIFFWNSCNNNIQHNRIWSSGRNGIYLDGIDGSADNNKILLNDISSNNYSGIFLRYADENIISQNTIKYNIQRGVWLSAQNENYCYDNLIYHNNFIENSPNAADEGYNNTWDNGYPSGGNYWDDYTGNDSDGDGIGDTPYLIPGGNNRDRYPLIEPYNNETERFFGTVGPICPFLNIVEIEIINGNESQIEKIKKMLNNRILHFIIPRFVLINVTDLDFKVSYTKKIPKKIPFFWKFAYLTFLEEYGNQILIDEPHIVTVKGLNGLFGIDRGKLIILFPPHFIFEGNYEEVTVEYINGV